jgi:hypothetical protein
VFRMLMPMYRGCPWLITGGYILVGGFNPAEKY